MHIAINEVYSRKRCILIEYCSSVITVEIWHEIERRAIAHSSTEKAFIISIICHHLRILMNSSKCTRSEVHTWNMVEDPPADSPQIVTFLGLTRLTSIQA